MIVGNKYILQSYLYSNDSFIKNFFINYFGGYEINKPLEKWKGYTKVVFGIISNPFKWYVDLWKDFCNIKNNTIDFTIWLKNILNFESTFIQFTPNELNTLKKYNIGNATFQFINTYQNGNFLYLKAPNKDKFVNSYIKDYDIVNSLEKSLEYMNIKSLNKSYFDNIENLKEDFDINAYYTDELINLIYKKDIYLFKKFNIPFPNLKKKSVIDLLSTTTKSEDKSNNCRYINNSIILNDRELCDVELILNGAYAPLKGFMSHLDYISVLQNMKLYNGSVWSLPICLRISDNDHKLMNGVESVSEVVLKDGTGYPIAKLHIEEYYKPNIKSECLLTFGSDDTNHPYIKMLYNNFDCYYIGGSLEKINDINYYDFTDIRLTPAQTKEYFIKNNWKTIVGFQTRNPMHRSHFELTKYAMNLTNDDNAKLFLNPVVGVTQTVDIDYSTRVLCYKEIIKKYPDNQVLLNLLPLSMRMAGPREAVHHAIIRKNYGCTHFVVGRDHAGPSYKKDDGSSFYGPYDAQELLISVADKIGIKILTSKFIVYNKTKNSYMAIDKVPKNDEILSISGTEQRRMLRAGEQIPTWFTFPEVSKILRNSIKQSGYCFYFCGLSGSGKTTLANHLQCKLTEKLNKPITVLDGDIVRQNLSQGLGFSKEDRSINVRRIGYVASEIIKHGGIVICANIAPYQEDRDFNRILIEKFGKYIEIFVNTPLSVCETRDVKGLYKLARDGTIKNFTGISDPFEKPNDAEICTNYLDSIDKTINSIVDLYKD